MSNLDQIPPDIDAQLNKTVQSIQAMTAHINDATLRYNQLPDGGLDKAQMGNDINHANIRLIYEKLSVLQLQIQALAHRFDQFISPPPS